MNKMDFLTELKLVLIVKHKVGQNYCQFSDKVKKKYRDTRSFQQTKRNVNLLQFIIQHLPGIFDEK